MEFSIPRIESTDHHGSVLQLGIPMLPIELKKKGKKSCCEKFRKGKRCKSCPMKGCA
jgi:hypothetical protein